MKAIDSILDRLPRRPKDRLEQLRDYAEGLAIRAEYQGVGCLRDLNDIVAALDELKDLRAWAKGEVASIDWKPQPKHTPAGRTPRPRVPA